MNADDELERLLACSDPAPALNWLLSLTEAQRRGLAPAVIKHRRAISRLAGQQWSLGMSDPAVAKAVVLQPTADLAFLATATLSELRAGSFLSLPEAETLRVLEVRRPDWLPEFAEWRVEWNWHLIRQMVLRGWIPRPAAQAYVPAMIGAVTSQARRMAAYGQRSIQNSLREEPGLLGEAWLLFEVEGSGENSLAAADKFLHQENWSQALLALSRDGLLPRGRLLDATLEALSRDFAQFRAGWFSRFHDALEPTAAEQEERQEAYLRLLGSSIPPTVSLALKCLQKMDRRRAIPAAEFLPAIAPVLTARGKATVNVALGMLDRIAKREAAALPEIIPLIASALLQEAREVQEAAIALLERFAKSHLDHVRVALQPYREAVVASLRDRIAPWFADQAIVDGLSPAAPPAQSQSQLGQLEPIRPVSDPAEIPHLAGQLLEGAVGSEDLERLLDALSRFADWRPADFAVRTGALAKRAQACVREFRGVQNHLALLLLSWIAGEQVLTAGAIRRAATHADEQFQIDRLGALEMQLVRRQARPALAAPSHRGGWIAPDVLVARWLECSRTGWQPHLHDRVLALLRLHPNGRSEALATAADVPDEDGRALRHALGGAEQIGRNAGLWVAAARSREPFGDLPELEAVHPKLGPNAGISARFAWQAGLDRQSSGGQTWSHLGLTIEVTPPPGQGRAAALLPVCSARHSSIFESHLLIDWESTWWPGNPEGFFAGVARGLINAVGYGDVGDREARAVFLPLLRPGFELREMALLCLALGLATETAVLRQTAEDAAIAVIDAGRIDVHKFAAVCRRLLATGAPKLARWGKSWQTVAAQGPRQTRFVSELLESCLQAPALPEPRAVGALLDLAVELASAAGTRIEAPATREFLGAFRSGKSGKAARLLLGGGAAG